MTTAAAQSRDRSFDISPKYASTISRARDETTINTIPTAGLSTSITVTFLGGLAPLFGNKETQAIDLPHPFDPSSGTQRKNPPIIADLIAHLTATCLSREAGVPQSKREMFVLAENERTIRPGILVLVNEADWELLGEGEATLESGDEVVFVSTLHGG